MKKIILVILAVCYTSLTFAQKQSRGDRFFENGDYINAIKEYATQLNSGEYKKQILENIATSYYNTFQFRKAYRALSRLTTGKFVEKDKTYDNEFNFKMYQVLSAIGEYDRAVPYLEKYKTNNQQPTMDNEVAIANIEAFKLKEDDFKVANAKSLNSEASEFGAVRLDSLVYFTSDRNTKGILGVLDKKYRWTHRPFLNIYKAELGAKKKVKGEILPFSSTVNSNLHEGNFCFTKDRKTMYISKSNEERGRKKFDSVRKNPIHLYKSVTNDTLWSKPEKLTFNNINYAIQHPALSPDGSKLYFASNMPGGYGDFDLYYVTVNDDGTYGNPVNLGDVVNTPNRDQFPFIADDGNLFFSSNGHLGLGMMDVFVAKANKDAFEQPINLGAPVNSSYDDFSFNYYNENEGYFASNRNKKSDEIYDFSQIGEVFLRPYNARFEVRDVDTKKYIPEAVISLTDTNKKEIHNSKTDTVSGLNLDVMPGRHTLKGKAKGYNEKQTPIYVKEKEDQTYVVFLKANKKQEGKESSKNQISSLNPEKKKEVIKKELLEDKVGPPVVVKADGKLFFEVPPIYFDYDKWTIREDSKKVLDDFALKLEKYKTVYIKISAHTDSRGREDYNQLLSQKRAEATRNYLALVGYVNARRIEFAGYGESQPLIPCDDGVICTEDEHQVNRRSDFEITKF